MKIYVDKNEVSIEYEKDEKINRGEYKAHKCDFNFSKEYDGLTKKAIFETSMEKKEMPIINNECDIPYEVLNSERINLRVYAYSTENDELKLRYSPKYSEFYTLDGSYIDGAEPSEGITPTQFEKYTDALNKGLDKVDDTLEELNELSKSVEAGEKDRNKKVDDAVSNIQDMTLSYNKNAENKENELNEIAEGVRDFSTAIQFPIWYIDDNLDLHQVTATNLGNLSFYVDDDLDFVERIVM